MSDQEKIKNVLDLIYHHGGSVDPKELRWILDQVVQTLSEDYNQFVVDFSDGPEGLHTYFWDKGRAPK